MAKKKKKQKNNVKSDPTATQTTIKKKEIFTARSGGQNALKGYSYQMLYSCYRILSEVKDNTSFWLEGLEDIDQIQEEKDGKKKIHFQLKYSSDKQAANFLNDILKNFIEVYLIDPNCSFCLIYDFQVAKGYLSKLFDSNMDEKAYSHWKNVVSDIQSQTPSWDWTAFNFDDFVNSLSFQKIEKSYLEEEIQNILIEKYNITTDNLNLFLNAIKVLCQENMENRSCVTLKIVRECIQSVKDYIDKGSQNPAYKWVKKISFDKSTDYDSGGFFEGKKATPADIAHELPVKRPRLEKEIVDSIDENVITVIKASSGQGKSTLALQAIFNLQCEYNAYQLLWCQDAKELDNIVQFIRTRIQLGEKLIILIDNLDAHFNEWNRLAQIFQSRIPCHYKLIITTREMDWYNYSGDLSFIHSLNIIKPDLDELEAKEIFETFRNSGKLHLNVTEWRGPWEQIVQRRLLIEYVYLLTHGEMLSDRISSQMKELGNSASGKIKCEILRKVCFADICGISLPLKEILQNQFAESSEDYGELLKSMENEFLVRVDEENKYVEGLHPVRSRHVVECLHEWVDIRDTALSVIKLAKEEDYPVLFSHLPEFNLGNHFFLDAVDILWDNHDLSCFLPAIRGIFSGCVMKYYYANKETFEKAHLHGGLPIIAYELCPFRHFPEFNISVESLDKMCELQPQNQNLQCLRELRDSTQVCNLEKMDVYFFCYYLQEKLCHMPFNESVDLESFAFLLEWLNYMNLSYEVINKVDVEAIWRKETTASIDCISSLMFILYCVDRERFEKFVEKNIDNILIYLKQKTYSHNIYIDAEENAIHVEYILRLSNMVHGKDESVSRIKYICKTLPIFKKYCADGLKPDLGVMANYNLSKDDHKEMPLENVVIMFHQDCVSLWNKSILMMFEFDTITDWLEYWFNIRKDICKMFEKCANFLCKLLKGEVANNWPDIMLLCERIRNSLLAEKYYPHVDRPFEEKPLIITGFKQIREKYFQSIQNFANQFLELAKNNEKYQRLAIINLKSALEILEDMQKYFENIANDFGYLDEHNKICNVEKENLNFIVMACCYYKNFSPSKKFNKYQIIPWYIQHCRDELRRVESALLNINKIYPVHFPNEIYQKNVLTYYPIVIENFDHLDIEKMNELFFKCLPFADSDYDFLVILSLDNYDKINAEAVQISKQWFVSVQNILKNGGGADNKIQSQLRLIYTPYQMLNCFSENWDILSENKDTEQRKLIENIADELWNYSKISELLTDPEDEKYLIGQRQDFEKNIIKFQQELQGSLSNERYVQLITICDEVLAGQVFNDESFNTFTKTHE